MSQRYKPYDPDQSYLLPPSLRDWLPEDHLSYFISDVVDAMDLSPIAQVYERGDGRGQPPYHPRMMVKLLLYGYAVGVPSSRKIEERTHTDVAFRVLAAGAHPDHDTIAAFRQQHIGALGELFVVALRLCREAGLVKLGHVALDGTKVKANASKHKAMSYGRMYEKERELREQVEALLRRAEEVDAEEDRRYGKGRRGDELPEELRFRQRRLKAIQEAKAALEAEAKEQAQDEGKLDENGEPTKRGQRCKHPPGVPKDKAQRNFTDPDSRIMKDGATKSFVQAYNGQVAVDAEDQVIVATELTQQANDKQQLVPLVEQIEQNLGAKPKRVSADHGYLSEDNIQALADRGIEGYIATGRQKHGETVATAPRGRIPAGLTVQQRMVRKLRTKQGRQQYALRKQIVEPVYGQIKQVRGFRALLLRGYDKARSEFRLIAATHNLLKLWRSGWEVQTT
jgi:transposase